MTRNDSRQLLGTMNPTPWRVAAGSMLLLAAAASTRWGMPFFSGDPQCVRHGCTEDQARLGMRLVLAALGVGVLLLGVGEVLRVAGPPSQMPAAAPTRRSTRLLLAAAAVLGWFVALLATAFSVLLTFQAAEAALAAMVGMLCLLRFAVVRVAGAPATRRLRVSVDLGVAVSAVALWGALVAGVGKSGAPAVPLLLLVLALAAPVAAVAIGSRPRPGGTPAAPAPQPQAG